jgi:hypothetical protein
MLWKPIKTNIKPKTIPQITLSKLILGTFIFQNKKLELTITVVPEMVVADKISAFKNTE